MYFPLELWRQIKNYMLGQNYWKRKMKLCFYNPSKPMWHPLFPGLKFKEGINSLHCSFWKWKLEEHNNYSIKRYISYGISYKGCDKRYEIICTNNVIEDY